METQFKKGVDYTGVCVVYFCHDGKGNFLMNKRSAKCRDEQGTWDIGGGGLEFGQDAEDAVKAEIKEEYCTDAIEIEFLGFRNVHRKNAGTKTHWLALDFKVLVDFAKVANGEPHKFDEIGWFTLNSLPETLHSQLPYTIEKYKERL